MSGMAVLSRLLLALGIFAHGMAQDGEQTALKMKKEFLEAQKERLLVDTSFIVTKTTSIHGIFNGKGTRGVKDSDMHVLGLAPDIGLSVVAEVVNASRRKPLGIEDAVKALQTKSDDFGNGPGAPFPMTGVLRIWPEHASGLHLQKPGATLEPMNTKDQNHLVEIHPITTFENFDLTSTCTMITGFVPHKASVAIPSFKKVSTNIKVTKDYVTVVFPGSLKYNYFSVFFKTQYNPEKLKGADGYCLVASIYDENGTLQHRTLKLVWGLDWPVAKQLAHLKQGQLLVMPRLSLPLVDWRIRTNEEHPELGVLDWRMPYELVVLGVMSNKNPPPSGSDDEE